MSQPGDQAGKEPGMTDDWTTITAAELDAVRPTDTDRFVLRVLAELADTPTERFVRQMLAELAAEAVSHNPPTNTTRRRRPTKPTNPRHQPGGP
jgi:hypothetical protein